MAPIKRRPPVDDGETIEVLESASSNLRRDSRKRQRLSATIDSVESDTPFESTQTRSFRQEIEELTEKLEAESSDSEAEVERATQVIARNKENLPAENKAMDCGVIESIDCTNFMCHKKLHVDLGPLINFIIGHNGSGKSAILSGITLALGGKATATNRGQSLKSFVKYGEETATLAVKIKNRGELAYKNDVYGNSIIVERHFSVTGASGFKLKNEFGKVISTKRAELDEIVDFYAFQLDNPVNVLTQDMARQFLNSSTPPEKYKLFLRGVQLEQLDLDYTLVGDSLDRAEARQESVNDDCKVHEERYRKAYEKMEFSKRQDGIRDKINDYTRQFAWAQVEDQETAVRELKSNLDDLDTRKAEKEEVAKEHDDELAQEEKILEDTVLAETEMKKDFIAAQDQAKTAGEQANTCHKELQEMLAEQREIQQGVQGSRETVNSLTEKIEMEIQKLADADGGRTAELLAAVDAAKANMEDLQNQSNDLHGQQPSLEQASKEAENKLNAGRAARSSKKDEAEAAQGVLEGLNNSRGNHMRAFDKRVPQLQTAISRESGWRGETPIGPIGSCVTLLRPEWSKILEKAFGAVLNAFCVTTKDDQSRLSGIIKRMGLQIPVMIVSKNPMDTTTHEPDPQFDTILRILHFDNTMARNALIMQNSIEKTVLVRKPAEATSILYPDNGRGPKPANIVGCFTFGDEEGTDTSKGSRFAFGARNAPKVDPTDGWLGLPRMKSDDNEQIRLQEDQVRRLKAEHDELDRKVRDFQQQFSSTTQAKASNIKQMGELKTKIKKAKETAEMRQREYEDSQPGDGILDSHRKLLEEAQTELELNENQLTEANNARSEKQAIYDQMAVTHENLETEATKVAQKVEKMTKKVKLSSDRRENKLRAKNAAYAAVKDVEDEKKKVEANISEEETQLVDFIDKASMISARVPVEPGMTVDAIDQKLERLNAEKAELEKRSGGSREELTRAAAEAKATLDRAKKQRKNLNELIRTLKNSLVQRHRRWYKFRNHICARAKGEFMILLSNRTFRGKMMIDHRNKLLDLQVEPDSTRRSGDGRQTKTLSGGEKSFSTICMLLALWNAMGSPIRCLDEFDVFMDSVNRDISTRMMIAAARESVGRQFILITPQAMGNVQMASDVKVIKLRDPERGQTTLNFTGAE